MLFVLRSLPIETSKSPGRFICDCLWSILARLTRRALIMPKGRSALTILPMDCGRYYLARCL